MTATLLNKKARVSAVPTNTPVAPALIAESFTLVPATVVLTGTQQVVVSKTFTVQPGEVAEFFAASIPILNTGGAVTAGQVVAQLFVDGLGQSAFNMDYPFGTNGNTTVSMTGRVGPLSAGSHTIDMRLTATASGLQATIGAGGLYIEQLGV